MKKFILGAATGLLVSGAVLGGVLYFAPDLISGSDTPSSADAPPAPKAGLSATALREMRPYVGQWVSAPAPLPGMDQKWLVLWVASDGSYQGEYHLPGGRGGIVTEMWKGKLKKSEGGVMSGSFDTDTAELTPLREFTLSVPEGGRMSMIGEDVSVSLKFVGL